MRRDRRAVLVGPRGTIDLGAARQIKPAGRDAFAVIGDGRVAVRDDRGVVLGPFGVPGAMAVAMSPDRARVAIGLRGGLVEVLGAAGQLEHTLVGHTAGITRARFT